MLFFEYFKKYLNKKIKITLKNEMIVSGILKNIDHFLNIQLLDTQFDSPVPALGDSFLCSIRGSSIKYVNLDKNEELEKRITDGTYLRFSIDKK
jgi:U6 snRNA-associated Sm-like protein LSm2